MKDKLIAKFSAVVNEIVAGLEHKTFVGVTFSVGVLIGAYIF